MKKLSVKVRSVAKFGLTLQNYVRRCFTDISLRGQSVGRAELNIWRQLWDGSTSNCADSHSPQRMKTQMNTMKLTFVARNLIEDTFPWRWWSSDPSSISRSSRHLLWIGPQFSAVPTFMIPRGCIIKLTFVDLTSIFNLSSDFSANSRSNSSENIDYGLANNWMYSWEMLSWNNIATYLGLYQVTHD